MAIDIDQSFYRTGTATVAANGTAVTGQGTLWTQTVRKGDMFGTHVGMPTRILSVNSNTSLTLAYPWKGAAQTASAYEIQFTPYDVGYQAAVRELLLTMASGNVDALAGLTGAANTMPYFTGAGTMALSRFDAWTRSMFDGGEFTFPSGFTVDGTITSNTGFRHLVMKGGGSLPDLSLEYSLSGNVGFYDIENSSWRFRVDPNGMVSTEHVPHLAGASDDGWCRFTNSFAGNGAETGAGTIGLTGNGSAYIMYSGVNVCAWDIDGRQTLGIVPGERITEGTINVNRVGHLVGDAGDGWVRMSNSLTGSTVGGSIRLTAAGTLSYTFDDVQKMYCNALGNMGVTGSLSKGSGTFLIDHPLDPENRDLAHGFVEAPEYVNIYRGETRLVDGRATVNLDDYFNMTDGTFWALNTDVTISSLQNQDGFARLKPLKKMDSGILEIICEDDESTDLVSWMVTGRRKDNFVLYIDENCERETGKFITEREKEDFDEVSL